MSFPSTGSPTVSRNNYERRSFSNDCTANVHNMPFGHEAVGQRSHKTSISPPDPLVSSRLGNLQPSIGEDNGFSSNKKLEHLNVPSVARTSEMEKILAKFSPRPQLTDSKACVNQDILTKLSAQQILLEKQKKLLAGNNAVSGSRADAEDNTSGTSLPLTFDSHATTDGPRCDAKAAEVAELFHLKQELLAANSKIAHQEQELAQTRVIKHTLDQALGPPSEADYNGREVTEQTISNLQNAFNSSSSRAFDQCPDPWNGQDDAQSDISDAMSAGAYNSARGFWMPGNQPAFGGSANACLTDRNCGEPLPLNGGLFGHEPSRFWTNSTPNFGFSSHGPIQPQQVFSGPSAGPCDVESQISGEPARFLQNSGYGVRHPVPQVNRAGPLFPTQSSPWGAIAAGHLAHPICKSPNRQYSTYNQLGTYPAPPHQPRPVGAPLSPTATEFTSTNSSLASWGNSSACGSGLQTYVSPFEPLNYRRLLDKNVSCDWKYIVDKIVSSNDQQASIFLQQKLKVGTTEQKYDIIEAIVNQAFPLMVNRFGNFLIQRCFEHGTPEQVVAIANAIRGNTLILSMDSFGCHVVQKALDCVPEEHKAVMVHELLRRIPETVIHRYACHVWQKLFELRWRGEPPQIMAKVNEALRGMWHEVALGETGSLVVQNIFENCIEEEKRPAIEEVIAKVDVLSHGQFGNWCIQHICEHGAPHDRNRAIEHILLYAADYSMDQYASKIVEKCLKIGGSDFLDRYLARVCTGRADRPRMPLIDIAGDQYGNYLIQWILMNAAPHQRELVATHIRKHMVSLRGSKFGSRVAMLCCNPSHATRPGPGAGMQIGRYSHFNDDRFPMTGQSGGRFSRANQWNGNYMPFR